MSYALQNRIFATGKAVLTVPGGGGITTATVNVTGIVKASDVVLLTLDLNGNIATVNPSQLPFVSAVTDAASFTAIFNLENSDPADATCFLNYVVIR